MKRFYNTKTPGQNLQHTLLRDTIQEAVADAVEKTEADGETRYVVQVVRKIEPKSTPVKISIIKG